VLVWRYLTKMSFLQDIDLFCDVIGSPWSQNVQVMLVLNKIDIFKEKIKR